MNPTKIELYRKNVRVRLENRFSKFLKDKYGENPTEEEKKKAEREYFIKNLTIESLFATSLPSKSLKFYENLQRTYGKF